MKAMEEIHAGTANQRDCLVTVKPGKKRVRVASKTPLLYEEYIRKFIQTYLKEVDVETGVIIEENGAVDYVIKARLEAALTRATRSDFPDKKVMKWPDRSIQ